MNLEAEVQRLNAEVSYLKGVVDTFMSLQGKKWQDTKAAAEMLGCSPSTLKRYARETLKSPYFRENVHFKRSPSGYQFQVMECQKLISQHTNF